MNKLRKHGSKGFTLVELIVVIVIIAILVAALTPAILSVIDRANEAADQAEARTIISAALVAATSGGPIAKPANKAAITKEITGTAPAVKGVIYFDGPIAVGFKFDIDPVSGKSKAAIAGILQVGECDSTNTNTLAYN